jgi:DNA ligase-1
MFPTLYKLTSNGKLEQWTITVQDNKIVTEFGHVDGKLQTLEEVISKGKNIGKSNETTPEQQAQLEAQAKWNKQRDRKGYVEDPARALNKESDTGGLAPMLAKEYKKFLQYLVLPCIVQRKYDGIRCIAICENGVTQLWSRKHELIVSVPHINAAVTKLLEKRPEQNVLDGELYVDGMPIKDIASYVRQKKEPKPGYEQIQYHVYDYPSLHDTNATRDTWRNALLGTLTPLDPIKIVPSFTASTVEEIKQLHDQFVEEGYEGAMLRNICGHYEFGKRSNNLLKYKEFDSTEFKIIRLEEGRGKFAGLAIFVCSTEDGKEFNCNPPGALEKRRAILEQGEASIGKLLTVKHFGYTPDGIPWHPVGVVIRDYE